jgi:hypothetical protein
MGAGSATGDDAAGGRGTVRALIAAVGGYGRNAMFRSLVAPLFNRRAPLVALTLFTFVAPPANGQAPPDVRIETSREGVHRVSGRAIGAVRRLDRVNPFQLRLTRNGAAVPIYVQGGADGRMDPVDDVLFYATAPSSPHAATETYVLTEGGPTWFYSQGVLDRDLRSKESDAAVANVVAEWSERKTFDDLDTLSANVLRGEARPFWWTASIGPGKSADRLFGGPLAPVRDVPAKLKVEVFGAFVPGVPQEIRLDVNGTEVLREAWDAPFERVFETTVPGGALRPTNHVSIANLSKTKAYREPGDDLGRPKENRLLLKSATLVYESRLVTPAVAADQIVVAVAGKKDGGPRRLAVENRYVGGFTVFDPTSAKMWRTTEFDVVDAARIPLSITTPDGAYEPVEVAATRERRAGPDAEGDYVVVVTTRFRRAVEPLVAHRRKGGLTPVVYEAREIYDAFGAGRAGPDAIRAFMKDAVARWKTPPKFLLLVGDADMDATHLSEKETLPTNLVRTAYNGATASDLPFGDVDDDGAADVRVGRIPARTPEDLLEIVARVVKAETSAPSGAWRRDAVFFAGEGRFGPAVDKMIEMFATNLIAKEIPADLRVTVTYGNPNSAWYWPAPRFNDAVVAAFNRGAALFNYVGHGSPTGFDRVDFDGVSYPILRTEDVARLDNGGRAGLLSIIACSTGRFDDPKVDCVGERLLAKRGGPLAVFASSRVSHPFSNALLGKGLVSAIKERRDGTIGAVVDDAKRRMIADRNSLIATLAKPHLSKATSIDDLVRDNAYLYNLLGDPASKLPLPVVAKAFLGPDAAAPGATIELSVETGACREGTAIVALERLRAAAAKTKPADPKIEADVERTHREANDVVVVEARGEVRDGAWSGALSLPTDLKSGDYVLTIYVESKDGAPDAAAARSIRIEAPPEK